MPDSTGALQSMVNSQLEVPTMLIIRGEGRVEGGLLMVEKMQTSGSRYGPWMFLVGISILYGKLQIISYLQKLVCEGEDL